MRSPNTLLLRGIFAINLLFILSSVHLLANTLLIEAEQFSAMSGVELENDDTTVPTS